MSQLIGHYTDDPLQIKLFKPCKEDTMKRNTSRKTDCKTVAAQKNEKNRKGFRTGMKAGISCGTC
ncbi:MAG: hypothetical protein D3914_16820 [Candidatus Electrothrix sp. LOE2]|nr:hypothetical protein [Candidatus Electrothrix sp. LOE2]